MYEVGTLVKMIDPMLIDIQHGLVSGTRLVVEKNGYKGEYGFYTTVGDDHNYYILNHQVKEVQD